MDVIERKYGRPNAAKHLVAVLRDSLLGLSLLSCATACCVVERFDLIIVKAALSLSYHLMSV